MGKHSVEHLSVAQRYSAWFMLAGQELVNKVVRLAIPYLVPFIAQEQGFGAAATARLLTGFSLGYVTCQVPAGAISVRLGPKFVQLCNNIGLAALFLGLPSLARHGSAAVLGAVLGVGVLQGPFMIAHHGMSYNWSPAEDSPERPWARFVMHLGNHTSKLLGPTLTPWLAGRFGWGAAARFYGCTFAGFAVLWQLLTSSYPPPPRHPNLPSVTAAADSVPPSVAIEQTPVAQPTVGERVSMVRLLLTAPQQACMWVQVSHDLIEFQTLGSWAPLYLHEVLAVPLHAVGWYTMWPMLLSLFGKFGVTAWEARRIRGGADRLSLRKSCTAIASGCIFAGVGGFALAPTPALATLAYCVVTAGGCFEYPGFIANLLEVEGDDAMMLEALSNPTSWLLVFLFGTLFPRLKFLSGSWYPLLLGPLVVRVGAQLNYSRNASVQTARAYLLEQRKRAKQPLFSKAH